MHLAGDAAQAAQVLDRWLNYFKTVSKSYAVAGRVDCEDCVQECCIELSSLISEVDPTDPQFEQALKTRIFRRLTDMRRAHFAQARDFRQETFVEDLDLLACQDDPVDAVTTRELQQLVEEKLTPAQKLVWRELVSPSNKLGSSMAAYREYRGRDCHVVPVSVYADATGLSYRQVRYALDRIRELAGEVFSMEGCLC